METDTQQTPVAMPTRETSWGSVVGIVIVITVLAIGSLYFWGKEISDNSALPSVDENATAADILAQPDATTEALKNQGASDEVSAIQSDVNATDLSGLDQGLDNINAEINN